MAKKFWRKKTFVLIASEYTVENSNSKILFVMKFCINDVHNVILFISNTIKPHEKETNGKICELKQF